MSRDTADYENANFDRVSSDGTQRDLEEQPPSNKLSIHEATMTLVLVSMSASFLSLPFAFYHMGIPLAIFSCLTIALLSYFSAMMLLKTKELTPGRFESIYDISYLLMGRPSIFIVIIVAVMKTAGPLIMYYILIGDSLSLIAKYALIDPTLNESEQD